VVLLLFVLLFAAPVVLLPFVLLLGVVRPLLLPARLDGVHALVVPPLSLASLQLDSVQMFRDPAEVVQLAFAPIAIATRLNRVPRALGTVTH
jgi:hypothetical protein